MRLRTVVTVGALAASPLMSACHWDWYKGTHIATYEMSGAVRQAVHAAGAPDDRAGYAIGVAIGNGDVVIDTNCADDGICISNLGDDTFWTAHEWGHIVARDLGFPFGFSDADQEHSANCFAELYTGHGPNFVVDGGYDDCPQEQVDTLYRLMVGSGFAEWGDFPVASLIPPATVSAGG